MQINQTGIRIYRQIPVGEASHNESGIGNRKTNKRIIVAMGYPERKTGIDL